MGAACPGRPGSGVRRQRPARRYHRGRPQLGLWIEPGASGWLFEGGGVRAIIAASFARIYFRNAVNNGILPVVCPEAVAAIEPGETVTIDVDRRLVYCAAGAFPFPALSPSLKAIIAAGGLISMLKSNGVMSNE